MSNSTTFSFDVPALADVMSSSFTIHNNSQSSILFPVVSANGVAPMGARDIVDPLKAIAASDEDFAIKTWQFVVSHETHYCSAGTPSRYAGDPMEMLYGYGIGCCDQVARVLAWLWGAAGYSARIASMTFHTVPEIYYGKSWHMLDPDHRTFYRNSSGAIASVAEIIANPIFVVNSGNSVGRDPVGSPSTLMAQLYVENGPSLRYSPMAAPDNGAQFPLAPGESIKFHAENRTPRTVAYLIPEDPPLDPATFGSVTFSRHIDVTQSGLAFVDGANGILLVSEVDGRKAATTAGPNSGSVTLSKTSPFPILALKLTGEFFVPDASSSLSVAVSSDGASWSAPVPIPVAPGAAPARYMVDLSAQAFTANTIFVQVRLNGPSNGPQIFSLDLETEAQSSKKIFPRLQPGQTNTLTYRDLSPAVQPRALDVEFTIPNGGGELPVAAVQSLVPEDPVYSTGFNYSARNLVDDLDTTLAYPASRNLDYVVTLERESRVRQVSLWWGEYGTSQLYLSSWNLYGRDGAQAPWTLLAQGGFPNAALTDIATDATLTDLRIVADSDNWIGLYAFKAYGDLLSAGSSQLVPVSQVPEDPLYSLGNHYGAANLTDGDFQTLAYPAATHVDYFIPLKDMAHVDAATIRWGYFGTNPIYVNWWSLYGRKSMGGWTLIQSGGFPASETTTVPVALDFTDLRVVAHSDANWIGIYELQVAASNSLNTAAN